MASFDQRRQCPYCGEWIGLSQCPIVDVEPVLGGGAGAPVGSAAAAPLLGALSEDDVKRSLGGADAWNPGAQTADATPADPLAATWPTADGAAPAAPALEPPPALPPSRTTTGQVADVVVSALDGQGRRVVARAERPAVPAGTSARRAKRFRPELPTPLALARANGHARIDVARCCPRSDCFHPLPPELDDRDAYVVALVGLTRASKTTILAALIEQAGSTSVLESMGLAEFSVNEESLLMMEGPLQALRSPEQETNPTEPETYREPIVMRLTFTDAQHEPLLVVMHDIAGENYKSRSLRKRKAAHITWADAAIFVIDPEATPNFSAAQGSDAGDDQRSGSISQRAVLSGLIDDLRLGERPVEAPLAIVLGKADLVADRGWVPLNKAGDGDVQKALAKLGAEDLVTEAQRWPHVSWHLASPKNSSGKRIGIAPLFATVFDEMLASTP